MTSRRILYIVLHNALLVTGLTFMFGRWSLPEDDSRGIWISLLAGAFLMLWAYILWRYIFALKDAQVNKLEIKYETPTGYFTIQADARMDKAQLDEVYARSRKLVERNFDA